MPPDNASVAKAAEVARAANEYQLLARLAVGGMAEIFLARGASVAGVARHCVLKRILRAREDDRELIEMFLDEARLAAQLQHPNIAALYDIGKLGDAYFFTMEYVHGETVRLLLRRARERNRPVPLACVLTIIASAAAGLHHAHERVSVDGRPLGIVHRDVSPSNVMVSYEGNVKIVDFGIAKAVGRTVVTRTGTVRGKIGYLSPEQCRGVPVDRRSDVFSLGIVMWEMLTGEPLYRRATDLETMTAIVADRPPPPSTLRAEVPRDVDDIVLRMLAQPVTQRFQTARAVVEAIELASMRAGTLLSTSAVSSLVRDLFGERVEPWRELDRATPPLVRVTLSSPLAEPGAPPPEAADLAALPVVTLSSAIDLFDDASSEPRDASGVERAGALDSATLVDPAPAVSTAATTVRAVRPPAMTRGRTGTTRVQRFATEVASSFTLPLLVMMILAAVLAAIGTWLVI